MCSAVSSMIGTRVERNSLPRCGFKQGAGKRSVAMEINREIALQLRPSHMSTRPAPLALTVFNSQFTI